MSAKVLAQVDAEGNATVVLNRPEVHNAFDPEMVDALTSTLRRLESRTDVRAVVLTGAGRNFCAGADIGGVYNGGYAGGLSLACVFGLRAATAITGRGM